MVTKCYLNICLRKNALDTFIIWIKYYDHVNRNNKYIWIISKELLSISGHDSLKTAET